MIINIKRSLKVATVISVAGVLGSCGGDLYDCESSDNYIIEYFEKKRVSGWDSTSNSMQKQSDLANSDIPVVGSAYLGSTYVGGRKYSADEFIKSNNPSEESLTYIVPYFDKINNAKDVNTALEETKKTLPILKNLLIEVLEKSGSKFDQHRFEDYPEGLCDYNYADYTINDRRYEAACYYLVYSIDALEWHRDKFLLKILEAQNTSNNYESELAHYADGKFKLANIETIFGNEATGDYRCSADLIYKVPAGEFKSSVKWRSNPNKLPLWVITDEPSDPFGLRGVR